MKNKQQSANNSFLCRNKFSSRLNKLLSVPCHDKSLVLIKKTCLSVNLHWAVNKTQDWPTLTKSRVVSVWAVRRKYDTQPAYRDVINTPNCCGFFRGELWTNTALIVNLLFSTPNMLHAKYDRSSSFEISWSQTLRKMRSYKLCCS